MGVCYIIRMFHASKMLYNPDRMLQRKQRNLIGSPQDTAALKSVLTRGFCNSPSG